MIYNIAAERLGIANDQCVAIKLYIYRYKYIYNVVIDRCELTPTTSIHVLRHHLSQLCLYIHPVIYNIAAERLGISNDQCAAIHIYVLMYTYICICIHIHMHIYIYIYVCVCVYTYTHVYIYMHIDLQIYSDRQIDRQVDRYQ